MKNACMQLYKVLKDEVEGKTKLAEMVDAFERMCCIDAHADDDAKLFETGVFDFTGQPLFYFELTRQLPNGEGEYFQIRLCVTYAPTEENKRWKEVLWEDNTVNFFKYVRKSKAYLHSLQAEMRDYEVQFEET